MSDYKDTHLIIGWIVLGPFYMIYGVCFDMKQLFKVLKMYKIDNDKEEREQEEQLNQDRIVIYNEVIDVLKSLLFIVVKADQASLNKSGKLFEDIDS